MVDILLLTNPLIVIELYHFELNIEIEREKEILRYKFFSLFRLYSCPFDTDFQI